MAEVNMSARESLFHCVRLGLAKGRAAAIARVGDRRPPAHLWAEQVAEAKAPIDAALYALDDLKAVSREAIWGALTILRLLYAQQQARGTGGYAHVTKGDIDQLEAAYAALGEETS